MAQIPLPHVNRKIAMTPIRLTWIIGLAAVLLGLFTPPAQALGVTPMVSVSFGFCTDCALPTFDTPTPPVALPSHIDAPNNSLNRFRITGRNVEFAMNGALSTGFCCVNPGLYPGHNFNGYRLSFSHAPAITGVQLLSWATNGLTPEVSWTSDSIFLIMWGGQLNVNAPVLLSYTTAAGAVPEPASAAMFGLVMLALGIGARRRRGSSIPAPRPGVIPRDAQVH